MTYKQHPSAALNILYERNPHQGANPDHAKVLFVGRDANWKEEIEDDPLFDDIQSYLRNGVGYWKENGIHHPFLNSNYRGDGRRYHKIFSKIGINKKHAGEISFVELLNIPTIGMAKKNNKLFLQYLFSAHNKSHLEYLDRVFQNQSKLIFLAWGLMDDFKLIHQETGLFEALAILDKKQMDITTLNRKENLLIHRHFSDAISNDTIRLMGLEIEKALS
jgi:hypothetical protein